MISWVVTIDQEWCRTVTAFATLQVTEVRRESVLLQVLLNAENYPPEWKNTIKKSNRYSRAVKQNTAPGTETGAKDTKAIRQYQYRVLIWQRDCTATQLLSIRPLSIDPHVLANIARTEQNSAVTKERRRGVGNSINVLFLKCPCTMTLDISLIQNNE